MRTASDNPSNNEIPAGMNEAAFIGAITESGYPLQGIVAESLNADFNVTEEWGYIDADSDQHRSLDLFASRTLASDSDAEVEPLMALLIECKRSKQPYTFFRQVTDSIPPRFPHVSGVKDGHVSIRERNGNRFGQATVGHALGLTECPFVAEGPALCASFTKAIPKGDKVVLSGTDPYNGLILPVVKALKHAGSLYSWNASLDKLYPTLMLCIAVVDAPMVLVESPAAANDPVLSPWVRILRQEANNDYMSLIGNYYYSLDVVHAAYFDTYLRQHVMPFATTFAERSVAKSAILNAGGTVENIYDYSWEQIEPA